MKRKTRPPVRFTATVKVMITDSVKRKVVSLKRWEVLDPSERDCVIYQHKWLDKVTFERCKYYRLIQLLPFENPVLGKLRKLLDKHQVAFTEKLIVKDDIEYIYFSTLKEEI